VTPRCTMRIVASKNLEKFVRVGRNDQRTVCVREPRIGDQSEIAMAKGNGTSVRLPEKVRAPVSWSIVNWVIVPSV
jgi:hypothetical protein